jgi:Helicase conserved C-terminal domain
LTELWYKHKTEYSFQELVMIDFLDALEKTCPHTLGWTPEAWVMNELLLLAQANTLGMPDGNNKPTGDPMGRVMFPTLPDRNAKFDWNVHGQLLLIIKEHSPRLESVIFLAFGCLRRGEKASFWAQFPSTQRIIHYVLKLCRMHSETFEARLTRPDRDALVNKFNSPKVHLAQFLTCSYEVGGQGLNLQKGSHVMVQVDPPINMAQDQQCVGRAYRVGQLWDVHVFRLFVIGSHDEWVHNRAFNMALPDLRANLDALSFFRQVGAEIPDGKTELQAAEDLKDKMSGVWLDRDAAEQYRLRHTTSFPPPTFANAADKLKKEQMVEELLQLSKAENLTETNKAEALAAHRTAAIRLKHDVPRSYEFLTGTAVFFYLYSLRSGFDACQMTEANDKEDQFLEAFLNEQDAAALEWEVNDEIAALEEEENGENGSDHEGPKELEKTPRRTPRKKPAARASEEAKRFKVQQDGDEKELGSLTVGKLRALYKSYAIELPDDQRKDSLIESAFQQILEAQAGTDNSPPKVNSKKGKGKRRREEDGSEDTATGKKGKRGKKN